MPSRPLLEYCSICAGSGILIGAGGDEGHRDACRADGFGHGGMEGMIPPGVGMEAGVRVGGPAGRVAVGTGQQRSLDAALGEQPQQHDDAVAALGEGSGHSVVVDGTAVSRGNVRPQVGGEHRRTGESGDLVQPLAVGEKGKVPGQELRQEVGRDHHVRLGAAP